MLNMEFSLVIILYHRISFNFILLGFYVNFCVFDSMIYFINNQQYIKNFFFPVWYLFETKTSSILTSHLYQ